LSHSSSSSEKIEFDIETPITKSHQVEKRDTDKEEISQNLDDIYPDDEEYNHKMLRKYGYHEIVKPIDEIDIVEANRRALTNSSIGESWKQKFEDSKNQKCLPSKSYSMFLNQKTDLLSNDVSQIKTKAILRGKSKK
jgi:hypothetical protein